MQRLVDSVRVGGREYRVIEDTETGHTRVQSARNVVEFPNRQAAFQCVAKLYRQYALDIPNATPGAVVSLPMGDGNMKTVTVMTVSNNDLQVVDKETGEQYRIPRTKGDPTIMAPNQSGSEPATQDSSGVVEQGPGYGTTVGRRVVRTGSRAETRRAPLKNNRAAARPKLALSSRYAAGEPDVGAPMESDQGKRRLTRHEIVVEAETLIRNALAGGSKIGLQELVSFMVEQYANTQDELYQGAEMAYQKVEWEGDEDEQGMQDSPQSIEDLADEAETDEFEQVSV